MIFEAGQRIVFIGDSITDCGRRDVNAPFGDGYMNLVRAFVTAARPDLGLTWANHGISGDTTRDLLRRWDADAIGARPDWLSVMIGINDIWRGYDGQPDLAVGIDEYAANLRTMLPSVVDATGCKLILADPFFIEPDPAEPQRADTDLYCDVVREIAGEYGALHVASQQAFNAALASTGSADWADDKVHPNLAGHAILARAYLDVIG